MEASASYDGVMARPREFDENDVLDRALQIFWTRGYDATSIDDLVHATGLGRASLYGAFGDKESLFRRVVERYAEQADAANDELVARKTARESLEALFDLRLRGMCPKEGPSGCFLLQSGTSGTSAELVHATLDRAAKHTRKTISAILERGVMSGEVSRDADIKALTDLLFVLLNGLATSARAGMPPKALKAATNEAMRLTFA